MGKDDGMVDTGCISFTNARNTNSPSYYSCLWSYELELDLLFSSEGDCTLTVCDIQCQSKKCLLQIGGSCRLVSKQGIVLAKNIDILRHVKQWV